MKTILLLLGALLFTGCATHQSPTGRGQTLLFSSQEMSQLGESSFAQIKQQEKVSQDKAVNAYVNCVANRVTDALPDQSLPWEVVVFESEQVNAFALPGGHIGVYTGLLDVATDSDQLATVIGHEIAHVLANHSNEQVSRAQMTGAGMQLADIALGAGGIADKDLYMAALGLGVQVGYILPYGRSQESEADVIGVELMAKAGFDPAASVDLWQNMSKAGGELGPELLSTHPSHGQRIAQLQQMQAKAQPLYLMSKSSVKNICQRPK
ncbi:M48 family metallopeptidase [Shewanella sp. 1CM18E]|uniref:M48 family metallopeptidase n=1 Tax=Shewanella sp. 1CM18E TaxID=2929169 RepID=UPI0020C101A6|nr:M48 family metallopeptidase [Shewanella sp. 1CM18E]MCK8045714.1 M48 family metallopeptidase [Shewanella sp. 1CM18E]